ncbi:MAG TPA: hypothetical protein VF586_01095, partial [Pyrinomonadaceae bacterium]
MNLRTKLIAVFAALALVPLAVVCLFQYRAGAGAVESLLRERAAGRASRVARDVGRVLSIQDARLLELARAEAVSRYALARAADPSAPADALGEAFEAYARPNLEYLQAVTFLDANRQPVFRLNRAADGKGFTAQTAGLVSGLARPEEGVWAARAAAVLRSPVCEEPYGAALRLTAPVFDPAAPGG